MGSSMRAHEPWSLEVGEFAKWFLQALGSFMLGCNDSILRFDPIECPHANNSLLPTS